MIQGRLPVVSRGLLSLTLVKRHPGCAVMPLIRQEQRWIRFSALLVQTMFRNNPRSRFKHWTMCKNPEHFINPPLFVWGVKKYTTKTEPLFFGDADALVDIRPDHTALTTKSSEFEVVENGAVGIRVSIDEDSRTCAATQCLNAKR